jgi:hypothetical protein
MRSLRHKAFEDLVVQDSGSVASDIFLSQTINDLSFDDASLYLGCVAGKASVLYSYIPIQFRSETANTVNVTLSASNTTSAYRISDVPIINAKYQTNSKNVVVELLNKKAIYGARFYEANGIANNFTVNTNINIGSVDTNVTFIHANDSASAYKYKVSYFIIGNINSANVEFEGTRCQPSYLLGD